MPIFFLIKYCRKISKIDIHCANATLRMKKILTLGYFVLGSIAQCEYKDGMVNYFGNSVI